MSWYVVKSLRQNKVCFIYTCAAVNAPIIQIIRIPGETWTFQLNQENDDPRCFFRCEALVLFREVISQIDRSTTEVTFSDTKVQQHEIIQKIARRWGEPEGGFLQPHFRLPINPLQTEPLNPNSWTLDSPQLGFTPRLDLATYHCNNINSVFLGVAFTPKRVSFFLRHTYPKGQIPNDIIHLFQLTARGAFTLDEYNVFRSLEPLPGNCYVLKQLAAHPLVSGPREGFIQHEEPPLIFSRTMDWDTGYPIVRSARSSYRPMF